MKNQKSITKETLSLNETKKLLNGKWIAEGVAPEFPKEIFFSNEFISIDREDNKYWFFWGEQRNRYFILKIANENMTLGCVTTSGYPSGIMAYSLHLE